MKNVEMAEAADQGDAASSAGLVATQYNFNSKALHLLLTVPTGALRLHGAV